MKKVYLLCLGILLIGTTITAQEGNNSTDDEKRNYRRIDPNNLPLKIDYQQPKEQVFPLDQISNGTGVWTELNPNVRRTDYLGVSFINQDIGWAVGAEGSIIKTTDGGLNWRSINSGVSVVLKTLGSFNGNIIITAGDFGTVLLSADLGETWQQLNIGATSNFWNIQFITEDIAWLVGEGGNCYRTTDGGYNWDLITTPLGSLPHWDVSFIDSNTGYICSDLGKVIKTTDGGNDWNLMQAGDNNALYTIVAVDSVNVTAAGQLVKFVYSSDGGQTWSQSLLQQDPPINKIAFINDSIGYAVGNATDDYKTTNKGRNWTFIYPNPRLGEWNLTFSNGTVGYNVGEDLKVKKTTDAGENWFKTIINENFKEVWFANEQIGWVLHNSIYKTTDGGFNWNTIDFPFPPIGIPIIEVIYFLDSLNGFAGKWNTEIFKTTDGGDSWLQTNISGVSYTVPAVRDICFINNNLGWATAGSAILKTTDSGINWYALTNSIPSRSIQFIDSLIGFTIGVNFNKTTDGGNSWEYFSIPQSDGRSLYLLNELRGWFTDLNKLYETTDGGINWTLVNNVTGFGFGDFGWLSKAHGFITGSKIYETIDSGKNWIDISDLVGNGLTKFHAPSTYQGYGVGNLGLVLSYIDTTIIPVELSVFKALVNSNNIQLAWQTASELNNSGFIIERSTDNKSFVKLAFIDGNGTTTNTTNYEYIDKNLSPGKYYYRLKQIDFNGSFTYSKIVMVEVELNPDLFELLQNYPNPFNPITNIIFASGHKGIITVSVYNSLGELVTILFNELVEPGKYYEVIFNGSNLASGTYLVKMQQSDRIKVNKMILLK